MICKVHSRSINIRFLIINYLIQRRINLNLNLLVLDKTLNYNFNC